MTTHTHPVHLVTYGDRLGYIRVLRFTDPARAYVALHNQCERDELTQIEALWAMRQLAEVCREIYAVEANEHGSGGTEGRATGRNPGYGCVGQPSVLAKAGPAQDDGYKQGGALTSRVSSRGPLPPLNTGAGDAVGSNFASPAAASETRRPPSWITWIWRWIGDTR